MLIKMKYYRNRINSVIAFESNKSTTYKNLFIIGGEILLKKEKGKILIEGMDLSGKTTITKYLSEILDNAQIRQRTLSGESAIFDFTVAQSKRGKLHTDLINELYTLAISEDLYNYQKCESGIIIQDSYLALRSYALMKEKNSIRCNG